MLTKLDFRNFKSWKDTGQMRMAPITVLLGSNSSGKTSLLQMLLMLKQTVEASDRSQVLNLGGDQRSLVDLGTFQDILFKHDTENPLKMNLEWKLPEPLEIVDPTKGREILFKSGELGFHSSIRWGGRLANGPGRAVVEEMSYDFNGHQFGMKPNDGKGATGKSDYKLISKPEGFTFRRNPGRKWPLPPPAKCYGFPDQVRGYFENAGFLSDFELEFEKLFSNIYYLGPLRDYPRREYTWAGASPGDMGRRGEKVVDALLASREAGKTVRRGKGKKSQTVEESVADWLKRLNLIHSFEVRPVAEGGKLFQVWVRKQKDSPEVLITDVGFGVSQILPVITLCYYAPEGATLIFEQPEIHLHPAVQAGLADVFIEAMKHRKVQIILESHSEHLFRRLQRRVAEEEVQPEQAALYFCLAEGGRSRLTKLELDMAGTIRNWPVDFFGNEYDDIAAMSEAALRRRIGTK